MEKKDLGNPAIIAAVSNILTKKKEAQPMIIQAPASNSPSGNQQAPIIVRNRRRIGVLGWALIGGVTFFGGRSIIRATNKKNILNQVDTNANYRAAQSIYNAIPEGLKKGNGSFINPFGFISDIGNQIALIWKETDTNRILDIAKSQITNYDETLKAFRILYGEDLSALLNKVLTMQQLNNFFDFSTEYKGSQREITNSNSSKTGYYGVATKETYALSTWFNPTTQAITSQIVRVSKLLPKGTFLGKYTGKEIKSIRADDNETYYMFIYGKSSSTGDVIHLYVPKSAVKFQSSATSLYKITWSNYKKGLIKKIG